MPQPRSNYLDPPAPTRKALSFSAARPRALAQWVAHLPKTNHTETSRKLYQAVREINLLKASPSDRMELLDQLAASIEEVSDGLFRKNLGHPFALNDLERKVVNLCQGLATELAMGYKAATLAAANSRWGLVRKEAAARSLHHCMWSLLPVMQRCQSLYLPPPPGLWTELHSLYQMGQANGSGAEVFNWGSRSGSLDHAYTCALLFSIAQPFQLQRHELDVLFRACVAWAHLVRLRPPAEPEIYLVDLLQDQGPSYHTNDARSHPDCLALATGDLTGRLRGHGPLPEVTGITPRLQEHLAMAWDRPQPRRFRRLTSDASVDLTLGLSSVHSQLCGNRSFTAFLHDYKPREFLDDIKDQRFQARDTVHAQRSRDVWEYSFDAGGNQLPIVPADRDKAALPSAEQPIEVPVFRTLATDMSPRGFCLRWLDQIPGVLVMGEVVSVKPSQSAHWTIGLLRWLRQSHGANLQLGVELLSPKAEACAARIMNKTGQHSDFLRAIVLPEIAAVAQPESVLLPRLKAEAGQKIILYRGGTHAVYRLVQKIAETSAVGQFSIRSANYPDREEPAVPAPGPDFGSDLWREF